MVDITLPKPEQPSSTDPHRGFGYVEFEIPADAKEAIENMDQSELFGRVIKVAAAKPQKESNEGLGSKTAIWEQVCTYYISSLHSPCLSLLSTPNFFFFFFPRSRSRDERFVPLTFLWGGMLSPFLNFFFLGGMARKKCYQ